MEQTNIQTNNAGFFIRFFAITFDNIFNNLILFVIPAYLFSNQLRKLESIDPLTPIVNFGTYFFAAIFIGSLIVIAYQIYFMVRFGGSLGKIVFGLKIVDKDTTNYLDYKTALYRVLIGYAFSAAFFGLGFLRVFKNNENLAWHDELFNTKVTKTGSSVIGIVSLLLTTGLFFGILYFIYELLSQSTLF